MAPGPVLHNHQIRKFPYHKLPYLSSLWGRICIGFGSWLYVSVLADMPRAQFDRLRSCSSGVIPNRVVLAALVEVVRPGGEYGDVQGQAGRYLVRSSRGSSIIPTSRVARAPNVPIAGYQWPGTTGVISALGAGGRAASAHIRTSTLAHYFATYCYMTVSSRRRKLNARIVKLKSLMKGDSAGLEHLRPPRAAILTMKDVKSLTRGDLKDIWVIEPQNYERVTRLNKRHQMFTDAEDADDHGLFHNHNDGRHIYHEGLRGAARSHTAGYLWWKVTPQLEKFIDKQIEDLESGPTSAMDDAIQAMKSW